MKTCIMIDCNNAAFDDDASAEVARILRELAAHIEDEHHDFRQEGYERLYDGNGNEVGHLQVLDGPD